MTAPEEVVPEVYDVVQLPDDSIQEGGWNVPPLLPSLHVTLPIRLVGEAELSATVTVNVTSVPEFTVDGFGVTVVLVEWSSTVNDDVPELVE